MTGYYRGLLLAGQSDKQKNIACGAGIGKRSRQVTQTKRLMFYFNGLHCAVWR